MKYVMFTMDFCGETRDVPIIFPDMLSHIDVAMAVQSVCPELENATPISAGFVNSMDISVTPRDKSVTLGLASRTQDGDTIRLYDYWHGMQLDQAEG